MSPAEETADVISRRRVPRRTFEAQVGVLLQGQYAVERSYQVGEGGMMLSIAHLAMEVHRHIAISFFVPSGALVMVRGIVRSVIPAEGDLPIRYGI